jgi:KRAB domain-containing zinc finger protein
MKSHRLLHTGKKPYACTDCGARFTDVRNYKRHRRIHDNAFPYPCTKCSKKYRHSNSLKKHVSTCHPECVPNEDTQKKTVKAKKANATSKLKSNPKTAAASAAPVPQLKENVS